MSEGELYERLKSNYAAVGLPTHAYRNRTTVIAFKLGSMPEFIPLKSDETDRYLKRQLWFAETRTELAKVAYAHDFIPFKIKQSVVARRTGCFAKRRTELTKLSDTTNPSPLVSPYNAKKLSASSSPINKLSPPSPS